MQPEWRLILDLDDPRAADHDAAGGNDDENRRPVAGVDEGIVEPAGLAIRPQRQKAGIQPALAAARASAGEPAPRGLGQRRGNLIRHRASLQKPKSLQKQKGAAVTAAPVSISGDGL